ncbi:MAG: sugar kinase [Actinomycetota bacterium]
MRSIRFIAVGECMIELFSEDPVPVDRAERFRCSFGGDAVQAALAASNLGTRSAVATVAGDDPFAGSLLSWLERSGISTDLVVRRPGFTGLYLISIDAAGERSFVYYRKGSAASTLDASDVAWSQAPDAILVSGITQAVSESSRWAAGEAARRTRDAGGLVVYDFNYRPRLWGKDPAAAREAFGEILPLCHVLRVSAPEETAILVDETGPAEAARALSARGPKTVLVGCGGGGAVLAVGGELERVPAPPVGCTDTTGAGDALTGAFVHGLLAGLSPGAAARLGVAAGSLAVTRRGGASAIPRGEEVRALVKRMQAPV